MPLVLFQPGSRPRLIQFVPCCAAKVEKESRVECLSPALQAALVKPAPSLLCHFWTAQRPAVLSANAQRSILLRPIW